MTGRACTGRLQTTRAMENTRLIDRYLPRHTFSEYHEILINAPMETVYKAARNFDLSKSKRIGILFRLRGLPTARLKLQEFITDMGFTTIEENVPTENLIGFWAGYKIAPIPSPEDFINNTLPARIKAVWNFYLTPLGSDRTRLSTETRVLCVTPMSKLTFGLYWLLIKPFSGAIRKKMLEIIKNDAEHG